jgi:hypothetical protein
MRRVNFFSFKQDLRHRSADKEYWDHENERYDKLDPAVKRKTRQIARSINWIIAALGLSFMFYPVAYTAQFLVLFICPWMILLFVKSNLKYYRTFSFKESPFPGFNLAIGISFWAIVIRSLLDFTLLDYTMLWWIIALGAPSLTLLFVELTKVEFRFDQEKQIGKIILFAVFTLVFSLYLFGSAIMVNCLFDYGARATSVSTVVAKDVSVSRKSGTSYYVLVQLPKEYGTEEKVRVSKERWDGMKKGQNVEVEIGEGLLGLDWLVVNQME